VRIGLLQEGDLVGTDVASRYHQMIEEVRLADRMGFSRGRAEICTARSNNLHTLAAFGVDPSATRAQWEDGMDLLMKAISQPVVEHDGPVWKVPSREMMPTPVTKPHPPVSVAASSVQSHGNAGRRGIGVITFDNYFGFDYLEECLAEYRQAFAAADHGAVLAPNHYTGLYVATAFCAPTKAEALDVARGIAKTYFDFILDLYVPLADNPGYEYLDRIKALIEHRDDMEWLCDNSPSVMIGAPDDFIRRIKQLEALGMDELLLRIDGVGHEQVMRSLELIGHEVIPVVDPAAGGTR
jgi:alkanesulfonate monooxygenase SsuD/methylene tetrahydromethanopterin reductase-like flavin-dependent oxidoreductase (luciferase family)